MKNPKHYFGYPTVLDALQKAKTCPLCHLEIESAHRYFDNLLYEYVNDVGLRAALVRSKGFCRPHGAVLLSFRDRLGTAILYQDQVSLFLHALDRMRPKNPRTLRKVVEAYRQHAPCPACESQRQTLDSFMTILLYGISEPEMCSAMEAAQPFCAPHFLAIIAKAENAESRKFLIRVERRKLEELSQDLAELCRKYDYRYRHEKQGRETDSWLRAVRMMVGME